MPTRTNTGRQKAVAQTLPAPTAGWNTLAPLANMPAASAQILTNWFPEAGYVRVRRGSSIFGQIGSGPVETLFRYTGATERLLAASGGHIWDLTTGSPVSMLSSLTSNRWQWTMFSNSAGQFLWCCNGADTPR